VDWLPLASNCRGHLLLNLPATIPQDKTETELLNFLLTRDSLFPTKYMILKIMDGKDGIAESRMETIEIKEQKYTEIYDFACAMLEKSYYDGGDSRYLSEAELWERPDFLTKYSGNHSETETATDELLELYRSLAKHEDGDIYWHFNG
jgi:hypothetical protein